MRFVGCGGGFKPSAAGRVCLVGLVPRLIVGGFIRAVDLAARCCSWSIHFCSKSPILTFLIDIGTLLSRISIRERTVVAM